MLSRFPKTFKAAIFDMDGTILDSMDLWKEIDRAFLKKRNLPYSQEYANGLKGKSLQECAAFVINYLHLDERPEDLIEEWHRQSDDAYLHHLKLKPFARRYLSDLYRRGVTIALATASPRSAFEGALGRNRVLSLFAYATDGTDLEAHKGSAAYYTQIAAKLSCLRNEVIVFEDSLHALQAAKESGMSVCAVKDPSNRHNWKQMLTIADYRLDSFAVGTVRNR